MGPTHVVAQYSYEATQPEDLEFQAGDTILVLSKGNCAPPGTGEGTNAPAVVRGRVVWQQHSPSSCALGFPSARPCYTHFFQRIFITPISTTPLPNI